MPIAITFTPAAPAFLDNVVTGTLVATIAVTMSNGSTFSGALGFAAPNNNDGGLFALSGSTLVTNSAMPPGNSTQNVTVSATQNVVTITKNLAIGLTAAPVPISISFSPTIPTIFDNSPVATIAAAINVTMSNGSVFAGTLGFAAPNNNDGARFAISGSNLITNAIMPAGTSIQNVTVSATQNSTTITQSLAVNVQAAGTASIVVQNANGTSPVTFATLQAAFNAVQQNQHVVITGSHIDTGQLLVDNVTVRGNIVTTNGQGGASVHDAVTQAKGILYISSNNVTIQDLEMFNGRAGDGDANAIRWEGHNLNIVRCFIHDCDMGVESANNGILGSGYCIMDSCFFQHNGSTNNGSATHNVYIGESCSYFTFKNGTSQLPSDTRGHAIKSRAVSTTIANSIIAITDGVGSRCIDVSAGGIVNVKNCVLEVGPGANTDLVGVGLEGIVIPGFNNTQQQCTISDCIVIADQGLLGGGLLHFNDATLIGTVIGCRLVSTVDNTMLIHYGQGQASGIGTVIDGGSNVQFSSRAAAGIAAYPALPSLIAADALAARLLDANWAPGTWKQITNSREDDYAWLSLRFDKQTTPIVTPGINNMAPWSGGCIDTLGKRLLVFGGGHQDSNNNSVYAFNFTTLAWERLSEPSVPNELVFGEWTDHTPESVHSYGSPAFVPTLGTAGTMFHVSGSYSTSDQNGGPSPLTWLFDLAKRTWTLGPNNSPASGVDFMLGFDPNTSKVFILNAQGSGANFLSYNFATNQYVTLSNAVDSDFRMMGCLNPSNSTFVGLDALPASAQFHAGGANRIEVRQLATGAQTFPPMAGDLSLINSGLEGVAITWDSVANKLVAWGGPATGVLTTDLFLLVPGATYTWTKQPARVGGGTPSAQQGHGTFGRFQYVGSHDCFALVNDVNEGVWFRKKGDF